MTHHAGCGGSLLRLEVYGLVLAAVHALLLDARQLMHRVQSASWLKSGQATAQSEVCSRRTILHVVVVILVVLDFLRTCRRLLVLGLQDKAWRVVFAALDADDVHAAHGAARQLLGNRGLRGGAGETNRRILCHLCCHTSCGSDRRRDFVAHDAGRGRFFGEGTCAAGEEELVLRLVFAREEQVRAVCVSDFDLVRVSVMRLTILSRIGRGWAPSWLDRQFLLQVKTS